MEAHGNLFHVKFSRKLHLMEAMKAPTSTDSGNFHLLPWKLPLTSMELKILPPTSMEISMEIYFHRLPPLRFPWRKLVVETAMGK